MKYYLFFENFKEALSFFHVKFLLKSITPNKIPNLSRITRGGFFIGGDMTKQLITIVRGIFMGVADSIPGVSGATIALMLGIYGKFVNSWSYFFFEFI